MKTMRNEIFLSHFKEHRNMPVDDALSLINRDFSSYKSGGRSVPFNSPFASDRHPDAIQVLLNMLADNHQLTVLQYDRVIKYLEIKREDQVQLELGDTKDLGPPSIAVNDPKQAELQSRILNILNSNKPAATATIPSPVPAPAPMPVQIQPTTWGPGNNNQRILWFFYDSSQSVIITFIHGGNKIIAIINENKTSLLIGFVFVLKCGKTKSIFFKLIMFTRLIVVH